LRKGGVSIPAKSLQHKEFVRLLRAAMAKTGWTGHGAATKLALAVGARPSLAASWLRGERIPRHPYLGRLTKALGISATALESREMAPRMPQDERSDPQRILQGRDVASRDAVAAWLALGREMQHNLAVKVIKEALEAQDFAGSPVLRALHGIAEKMDEMGYSAMSRHIWAEMGKYFGQQLPPGDKP